MHPSARLSRIITPSNRAGVPNQIRSNTHQDSVFNLHKRLGYQSWCAIWSIPTRCQQAAIVIYTSQPQSNASSSTRNILSGARPHTHLDNVQEGLRNEGANGAHALVACPPQGLIVLSAHLKCTNTPCAA